MSLALFNAVPIEVLLDAKNHPWFKRSHVGKYLGIAHIHTSVEHLDDRESRARVTLEPACRSTACDSKHKEQQNHDIFFISLWCYACDREQP